MYRLWVAALLLGLLSACSALPEWPWLSGVPARHADPVSGQYDFGWRLSGDRAVAPLQVFDNGRQMWLQFAPGQAVPAIFEHTERGDRPLDYHRNGPYLVLSGVWPHLILRGGHLKSFVDRLDSNPVAQPASESASPALPERSAADPPAAEALAGAPLASSSEPVAVMPATVSVAVASAADVAVAAPEPVPAPDSVPAPALSNEPAEQYHVSPDDKHLRAVLSRWAHAAGWTFDPEHWAVDADIPIVGSAHFESGFKLAVQELVASTELADRPLQPCFYSNRVLRIVPYAQLCDRTANLSESS